MFQYYHQYRVEFNYQSDSGSSPPIIAYFELGVEQSTTPGIPVWADAGSTYNYQNPLQASTLNERWYSQNASGIILSPAPITVLYYHQYLVNFEYSVEGGGIGYSPPTINFTSFAHVNTTVANASVWVDYGTSYSYPNILGDSTNTERWIATSIPSGNVVSSLVVSVNYQHQFYVTLLSAEPKGGSVSPQSGWYNAGQALTLVASPMQGWKFENWLGSYSGNTSSTTLTVNSPVNETAVFYPGIIIKVSNGGYVVYNNETESVVEPGTTATVYVPVGNNLSLSAHPSLFFYLFDGWSGAVSNNSETISMIVDSPITIEADFGYNYLVIGLLSGVVIIAITVAAAFLTRRSKVPISQ